MTLRLGPSVAGEEILPARLIIPWLGRRSQEDFEFPGAIRLAADSLHSVIGREEVDPTAFRALPLSGFAVFGLDDGLASHGFLLVKEPKPRSSPDLPRWSETTP